MSPVSRPHVLGVDDAPFAKWRDALVPIVAVATEGADLVEAVAVERFPVDGPDATARLARWIRTLRVYPSLHAVILGGITIAGLGLVDLEELARQLQLAVLAVTRRDPTRSELRRALTAAGLIDRLELLERCPPARLVADGLYVASAGADADAAERLIRATLRKSRLPEPLRLAHLIARAIVTGESRGRV